MHLSTGRVLDISKLLPPPPRSQIVGQVPSGLSSDHEWLRSARRNLKLLALPEAERIIIIEHFLVGAAERWWQLEENRRPGHQFSWEDFEQEFARP